MVNPPSFFPQYWSKMRKKEEDKGCVICVDFFAVNINPEHITYSKKEKKNMDPGIQLFNSLAKFNLESLVLRNHQVHTNFLNFQKSIAEWERTTHELQGYSKQVSELHKSLRLEQRIYLMLIQARRKLWKSRGGTVIPIVKNCPKNQILSENISRASIYPSQVIEVHFYAKNSYFLIFIKIVHVLAISPYELQEI